MAGLSSKITLDRTLRDLYSLEQPEGHEIIIVNHVPTSKKQMIRSIPLSRRLAYQAPFAETEEADSLARMCLQVVPQTFGSIAGNMPLVLFDLDEDCSPDQAEGVSEPAHRKDYSETFDQLDVSQRPQVSFVEKPENIQTDANTMIAVSMPMDCLSHARHTVDPDVHYALASKKELALSGLPTPPSQIIMTELQPEQAFQDHLVEDEVARMMDLVIKRSVPFVFKMPQAALGFGTLVVRNEEDHQEVIRILPGEIKVMLQQLNTSNIHMEPCCLILQDFIPGESHSLSLFVTQSGRPVVTACCKQVVASSGRWGGAFISYKEQGQLQHHYAELVQKLASYVHSKDFYGPMGVDVMTDEDGKQLIIDMNMRVTGSHPLGFLKNHFSQRNLNEAAVLFPLVLNCTREDFLRSFERDVSRGSVIINGWCHDKEGKMSLASVTLAAEDSVSLDQMIKKVNAFKMN